MIRRFIQYAAVPALLLLFAYPMDSNAQSTQEQIEDLKQQIEILQQQSRQQIDALKQQIDKLQAERAADLEKVTEIAESQKKDDEAWYNKFLAKYDKGLIFQSDDGNYRLRFRINAQAQLSVNDTDGEPVATDFDISSRRRRRFS